MENLSSSSSSPFPPFLRSSNEERDVYRGEKGVVRLRSGMDGGDCGRNGFNEF